MYVVEGMLRRCECWWRSLGSPSYFHIVGLTSAVRSGQADIIQYLASKGMLDDKDDLIMALNIADKSGQPTIRVMLEERLHNQQQSKE